MNLKRAVSLVLAGSCTLGALCFSGCKKEESPWVTGLENYDDTARPNVEAAYPTREDALAAGGGWYQTMNATFEDNRMPEFWQCSPHGLRKTEYWCDNCVSFEDGKCVIKAYKADHNQCDVCPASGEFTSGIETRKMVDGKSVPTWQQAFGYFECRVKFPVAEGMWSAFWLQSDYQGKLGNDGRDGTEIDVYESAFRHKKGGRAMGHALLWDGYGDYGKTNGAILDSGVDLYDGEYHTFGLRWSPTEYVFYIDGKATWATNGGGVSRVPEFLRLTNEIRHGWGPHGVKLKEFQSTEENPGIFYIDWVKVYQNTAYEPYIQSDTDFQEVVPETVRPQ